MRCGCWGRGSLASFFVSPLAVELPAQGKALSSLPESLLTSFILFVSMFYPLFVVFVDQKIQVLSIAIDHLEKYFIFSYKLNQYFLSFTVTGRAWNQTLPNHSHRSNFSA